jgi:hypothetical protein
MGCQIGLIDINKNFDKLQFRDREIYFENRKVDTYIPELKQGFTLLFI